MTDTLKRLNKTNFRVFEMKVQHIKMDFDL